MSALVLEACIHTPLLRLLGFRAPMSTVVDLQVFPFATGGYARKFQTHASLNHATTEDELCGTPRLPEWISVCIFSNQSCSHYRKGWGQGCAYPLRRDLEYGGEPLNAMKSRLLLGYVGACDARHSVDGYHKWNLAASVDDALAHPPVFFTSWKKHDPRLRT